jgi:capsular exopolysaccharide synthesis family protein
MSTNPESESAGLGLRHYLDVLRRRWWIVATLAVLAGGAAFGLSSIPQPVYRAQTKIVVGQGGGVFPPSVSYAIQPLTATMGNLVTSNVVAADVIRRLGLKDETPESLLKKISVVVNPTTAVIAIDVDAQSKGRATDIAREVGFVFSGLVQKRFGTDVTAPAGAGAPQQLPLTATIFDPAHAMPDAVSPKPKRDTVLAVMLGVFLGLIAAFLREHFDRKLRTREAVEERFGVPVIGQIPWIRSGRDGSLVHETGPTGEALRALRANLQYLGVSRPLRTILVTSASPGQGKTTTTANLAVAIGRSGASTIAVEADLRRPALGKALGVRSSGPGLTGLLVGSGELEASVVDIESTGPDGGYVSLLPSGPLPPNPSELLSSLQMTHVLDRLSSVYDYVLIDSPPLLLVADALELARMVDGVVVVARRNDVTSEEARDVRDLVQRLGMNLLGVVLTDVEPVGQYYGAYESAEQPALVAEP